GWTRYELPDDVYNEILQHETTDKLYANRAQTIDKLEAKPITQPNTTPLSSSSFYKDTTTSELLEVGYEFNITSLQNIGFTETHLKQLVSRSGLSAQVIQDSIDSFAYDLRKNNVEARIRSKKTDPLRY